MIVNRISQKSTLKIISVMIYLHYFLFNFLRPVYCKNVRNLDDTEEFAELMQQEGDLKLDRSYTLDMDKWSVIVPKAKSIEGNGVETIINLKLQENRSIRLFSDIDKISISHVYFNITHESNDILISNSIINSISESSIYDVHMYLSVLTTISTSDSVYGILSNTVKNSNLNHVGLYFTNITITGKCDTFGLLVGKITNSYRREYLGLFIHGNDIKMKDITSILVHLGLLLSSTENLDISYSFVHINSIDVFCKGLLRLGGIVSIPEDDISFFKCYTIIKSKIDVVNINFKQNYDNIYIGGLLGYSFDGVKINDSFADIHIGRIEFNYSTQFNRKLFFGGLIGFAEKYSIMKNIQSKLVVTDNITSTNDKDHSTEAIIGVLAGKLESGVGLHNSYLEFQNYTDLIEDYFIDVTPSCSIYDNNYFYSTYTNIRSRCRMPISNNKEIISLKLNNYEYDNEYKVVYYKQLPYYTGKFLIDKYETFNEVDIKFSNNEYVYQNNGLFAVKNGNLGTFEIKSHLYPIQIFAKEDKTCLVSCNIKLKSSNDCYYPLVKESIIYPTTNSNYLLNNKIEVIVNIMNCKNEEYISNYTMEYEIYNSNNDQLLSKDVFIVSVINNHDTKDFLYIMNNETNININRNYTINMHMLKKYWFEPKFKSLIGIAEKSFLILQYNYYEEIDTIIDVRLFRTYTNIEVRDVYISIDIIDKRISDKNKPMEIKIRDYGLFYKISDSVLENIHIYLPSNFSMENENRFTTIFCTELENNRINNIGVFFDNLTLSSSLNYPLQFITLISVTMDTDSSRDNLITGLFAKGKTLNVIVKQKQNIYISLLGTYLTDYNLDSCFVDIETVNIYSEAELHFCLFFNSLNSRTKINNSFGIIRKSLDYLKYVNGTNYIAGFSNTQLFSTTIENSWIYLNFGSIDLNSLLKDGNRTLYINGLAGEDNVDSNYDFKNVQITFILSNSISHQLLDKIYMNMLTSNIAKYGTMIMNNSYLNLVNLNGKVDIKINDILSINEEPKIDNSFCSTSGDIDINITTEIRKDSIFNIKNYLYDYELSDDNEILYYKYMPYYNRKKDSIIDPATIDPTSPDPTTSIPTTLTPTTPTPSTSIPTPTPTPTPTTPTPTTPTPTTPTTITPSTSIPTTPNTNHNNLSAGEIIGIAAGILSGIVVILLIVICFYKKYSKKQVKQKKRILLREIDDRDTQYSERDIEFGISENL